MTKSSVLMHIPMEVFMLRTDGTFRYSATSTRNACFKQCCYSDSSLPRFGPGVILIPRLFTTALG